MACGRCNGEVPGGARFCPACGAETPVEDVLAVATYRDLLAKLAGRTEGWALAELSDARAELGIRPETHDRLVAELGQGGAGEAPVAAWVDARPIGDFRAGDTCMLRLRLQNRTARPIATLAVTVTSTAAEGPLPARTEQVLGPGEDTVVSLWFRATAAGHHRLEAAIDVVPLRGSGSRWATEAVPFQIGAAAALHQQIHIDARSQRVGVFENIGVGSRGGLIDQADWRPVAVRAAVAAEVRPAPEALPEAGVAVVVRVGDPPLVELDGHRGALVEFDEPELAARLAVGDRFLAHAIGRDAFGRPLFSTRASRQVRAPEPLAPGTVVVGPGDDLAEAVRAAPSGSRIEVRGGTHTGPLVIDRPLTLVASDGAAVQAARGPVVRIGADAVLQDLTIRGAAPAGQYAADAVEVRSGRVVLEGCRLTSDAPGNLVPGRAVAVAGGAEVELRRCRIEGSGVGVAIDVSWSGFATDQARGARVRVVGCEILGVGVGAAVAGSDRELRVVQTRFAGVGEAAVRVIGAGSCTIESCTIPTRLLVADRGANLVVKA